MADGLLNKASIILTPTGYKAGTLYNVAPVVEPYEDFDFARTSTATRINSSGLVSNVATGVPRISYDSNGDNGHILLEPTSTNLITYSEDFSQSGYGWNYASDALELSESNSIISPDGTQNADKISKTATRNYAQAFTSKTINSGQSYSWSMFMKKGTHDIGFLSLTQGDTEFKAYYDLTNVTSGMFSGSANHNIQDFGNGWFRCSLQNISSTTDVSVRFNFGMANSTTSENWASASEGDGLYAYFWGAQLEQQSYATSYIPTLTGSTETRATETATGAGSATLINSTEGVLYAEIAALANDGSVRYLSLTDGTSNNRVLILYYSSANNIRTIITSGGTNYMDKNYGVTSVLDFHKVAIRWKANDFSLWVDGSERKTDTSGSVPIGLNSLSFDSGTGSSNFYGKCKAIAVFNEALSDSELTQLTT